MGEERNVKSLMQVLKDKDQHYEKRMAAAVALGEIADKKSIEALIQALDDGSESVQQKVRSALIKIGPPAVEPLIHALESERKRVRWNAALVLRDGKLGDERAVYPLIRALGDETIRSLSAQVLGRIGDPRAIKPLINVLKSIDGHSAAEALVNIGSPAVKPLINAMKDKYWGVRDHAAEALGKIGDSRAVDPLIKALKDESEHVRRETAEALGRISDIRAIEPLTEALEVEDRDFVRRAIVEALGAMKNAKAIASLVKGLGNINRDVRESAKMLLVNKGSEAMASLVKALGDFDRDIQNGAAEALMKMEAPCVESLIQALSSESRRVRVEAAWLLGEFGDKRAVEPLTYVLKDEDEEVRITADKALKKIVKKASQYETR